MAIYKPSNFYPSMDEIDMLDSNTFECLVNTDGSKVKAYKVEIYSDEGILLYERFGEFDKPVGNNEYAQIEIKPYEFSGKQYLRANNKSYIKADSVSSFLSLNPYAYDYCPYNIYEILYNDSKYFWIKGKSIEDEDFSNQYNIIGVSGGIMNLWTEEVGDDETSNISIYDTLVLNIKEDFNVDKDTPMILSVGLNNNFNYKWKIRFYEDSLKEIQNRKILVNYDNEDFEIYLNGFGEIISQSFPNNWNINKYYVGEYINNERQDYDENIHEKYDQFSNIYNVYPLNSIADGFLIYLIDKNNIKIEKYNQLNANSIILDYSIENVEDKYINDTFVSSGYTTGTNKSVIWYNNNSLNFNTLSIEEKELEKVELIDKYIKENNYIEIMANEDNSFFFEEYKKKQFLTTGECYSNGFEIILKNNTLQIANGQTLDIPYFDFSKTDEVNRYIVFVLDPEEEKIQTFLEYDNKYVKPYLSVFKNNNKYIFVEKISKMLKKNKEWVIQIENKQLLQFLNSQNKIFIMDMESRPDFNINGDYIVSKNGIFRWNISNHKKLKICLNMNLDYWGEKYSLSDYGRFSTHAPDRLKFGGGTNYDHYKFMSGNLYNNETQTNLTIDDKLFISNIQFKLGMDNDKYYPLYWLLFPDSFDYEAPEANPYSSCYVLTINNGAPLNINSKLVLSTDKYYQRYSFSSIKEYDELAKGVDPKTGKNISLSSNEYKTFRKLGNNLEDIFPELVVAKSDGSVTYSYLGIKNPENENDYYIGGLTTLDYVYPVKNIQNQLFENFAKKDSYQTYIYNFDIKQTDKENYYDIYYTVIGELKGKMEGYIKNIYIEDFSKKDLFAFLTGYTSYSVDYDLSELKVSLSPKGRVDLSIPFQFNFLQREKIYDHVKNLGNTKDINKIIFENDFSTYLKDLSSYNLYTCDNKHTNTSLYVSTNGEIQVGRYIRFPTIDGLFYNSDNFPSTSSITSEKIGTTGYYVNSNHFKITETIDMKLNNVKNFFKENKNFILYKIIGYDQDTGEIRLENNVYRKLTNTDIYEIWERREESGETTEEYYSRKLPAADDFETFLKVGGENMVNIPCRNSNKEEIFVQPNLNMKPDSFYSPQLVFNNGDIIDVNFVYDMNENYDYSLRNKTINTLDNSQWIITTNDTKHPIKCESQYSIYNAYVDSVPESYFYARDLANINIRYTSKEKYKKFEDIKNYPLWSTDSSNGQTIIHTMNPVFIGEYLGNTPVKRFRYKLYSENNDILLDSQNIYSNDIVFEVNGLKNQCIYLLSLEVEDQYGYVYSFKESFKTSFNINYTDYNFYIVDTEFGNGVMLYTDAIINGINISGGTAKQLENSIVEIYRSRGDYLFDYVTSLDINYKNVVKYKGNYIIGNIDYNVGNDTWYNYMFVIKQKNDINENYNIVQVKHKTCFNKWSISNIIRQDDNKYKVQDIWNIKYNLETGDITNNTSVTKWDTLGQYSQVSVGERGYESSSVSCLLGDISQYVVARLNEEDIKKEGYNEFIKDKKYENNIKKLNDWKNFCKDGQLKLLKDYKGNKWIVQILENPVHTINIKTMEQMTTISFNWSEVMDSTGLSIIGDIIN